MIETKGEVAWWREHSAWWHLTKPLLQPISDRALDQIKTIMVLSGPLDETVTRVRAAARLAGRYAKRNGQVPQLVFNGEPMLFQRLPDWLCNDQAPFAARTLSEIQRAFEYISSYFNGQSNTWTNAHMAFIQRERFAPPWLVITSDYHALRVKLTFESRFQSLCEHSLNDQFKRVVHGVQSGQMPNKASEEIMKIRKYSLTTLE